MIPVHRLGWLRDGGACSVTRVAGTARPYPWYEGPRVGSRGDRPRIEPEDLLPPVEVDEWILVDPPEPWFIVDRDIMDVGGDEDRPRIDEEDGGPRAEPAGPPAKVAGPPPAGAGLLPFGPAALPPGAVPAPGADQAAAAAALAQLAAAAQAQQAAAAAQAAAWVVPPGVGAQAKAANPVAFLQGIDPAAILAALQAQHPAALAAWAQGHAGAPPPPAAKPPPKAAVPVPGAPKAAVHVPGVDPAPEDPDDAVEHVTPDDSWDAPMRQLHEMFRRHNIPPDVVDAFHRNSCVTPYDVMRSGTNKEKAQANMCLSLLLSFLLS